MSQRIRHFAIGLEDLRSLNPNTLTCPVFRTAPDAELTAKIYRNVPVFIQEATPANPWNASYLRMLDMASDSELFSDERRDGMVALYEAKMIWHFDHRFASLIGEKNGGDRPSRKFVGWYGVIPADPHETIVPRYWVQASEVAKRLGDRWRRNWLLTFRDVTGVVNERTAVASIVPLAGVGHTAPLILCQESVSVEQMCALLCNLNSLVLDYVVRLKISGSHLTYSILNQLPVLPPSAISAENVRFITPRVLELVYTAWDIQPFADDLWLDADDAMKALLRQQHESNRAATGGHVPKSSPPNPASEIPFPPFRWDEPRRARLRAELDAYYARLYGLTRDELRYMLDPADVYGPDFPGETFRVLKEKEIKQFGEYRTRRLVLEAWNNQELTRIP